MLPHQSPIQTDPSIVGNRVDFTGKHILPNTFSSVDIRWLNDLVLLAHSDLRDKVSCVSSEKMFGFMLILQRCLFY